MSWSRSQELEVDLDLPPLDVDRWHGVKHERDEQLLTAVEQLDLQGFARRKPDQPPDDPDLATRCEHRTSLKILGPPLPLRELGSVIAARRQRLAPKGFHGVPVAEFVEAHDRALVGPPALIHDHLPRADEQALPLAEQQ